MTGQVFMIEIMNKQTTTLPSPFAQLPANARRETRIATGETLFRQGEACTAFYLVISGLVHQIRHTQAGETLLVHRAGDGETIAEASLFASGYHCDCVAVRDTRLVSFNKSDVLSLLNSDASFAASFVKRLAHQVQGYRRRLELIAIRSAEDRVFAALSDGWIANNIRQFADEIALSPEATYRAFASLTKSGRVRKHARGCYVLDKT